MNEGTGVRLNDAAAASISLVTGCRDGMLYCEAPAVFAELETCISQKPPAAMTKLHGIAK